MPMSLPLDSVSDIGRLVRRRDILHVLGEKRILFLKAFTNLNVLCDDKIYKKS